MRCFLVGILLFLAPATAFAQVRGEVESIGFQNRYRPDCWTPMTVKLVPETGKSDTYLIQVKQEDLDRDRVIFQREVTVTGNTEGQTREQRFRAYFIPQPTGGGLPDARDPGMTKKDLDEQLVVNLCTESGKLISRLPITNSIFNVDPRPGMWDTRRGTRFVLAVSDGRSQLIYNDRNTSSGLLGIVEDVEIVAVRPSDLPENVIGYDAVDGLIWLDADPASLRGGGDEKRRALDSYIRRGGHLVICQAPEWQKNLEFADLLPVTLQSLDTKETLEPLRELAMPEFARQGMEVDMTGWNAAKGPFRLVRATAKPDAVVNHWIEWDEKGTDRSPFIARHRVGAGAVTWVAQDLGDPAITGRARTGWPFIWERVFDWNNRPVVLRGSLTERDVPEYALANAVDFGASLLPAMELPSTTAWLITLAIVFFIAYWVVAGPGVFAYLSSARRTSLSWFAFAASALVATAVTFGLVRLVLRGAPQARHFSLVRVAPDAPAVVNSRFGLYIKRDGYQTIAIKDTAPGEACTIAAYPQHPVNLIAGSRDVQGPEYAVPIADVATGQEPSIRVPYSSSLKKFQAEWVGQLDGKVEGSATLRDRDYIGGAITNGTGRRLRNIYLAFRHNSGGNQWDDWILYLPTWEPGVTLDLNREFNKLDDDTTTPLLGRETTPERGRKVRGTLERNWLPYWYDKVRGGVMGDRALDDSSDPVRRSLPMLSLFKRLAPVRKDQGNDRFELVRRGARDLDVSDALAAGALIVLAEADGPIPFPLHVGGDRIAGEGTILYQFIIPMDQSKVQTNDE